MNQAAKIERPTRSVLIDMADRFGMEASAFEATVRTTCFPPNKNDREPTREEFAAFLLVAKEYGLNPLTKEIYAFRGKNGGIQPIVSIDGWMNLINSHPAMDGLEFDDHVDRDGTLTAVTARIWRKDRTKPIVVTEYMVECQRGTEPWRQWPRRMLRHKAAIQCARYAFGFSGIVDQDEFERQIDSSDMHDVSPTRPKLIAPSSRDQRAALAHQPQETVDVDARPQPEREAVPVEQEPSQTRDAPKRQSAPQAGTKPSGGEDKAEPGDAAPEPAAAKPKGKKSEPDPEPFNSDAWATAAMRALDAAKDDEAKLDHVWETQALPRQGDAEVYDWKDVENAYRDLKKGFRDG